MEDSILIEIKHSLGLPEDYTPFDPSIIMFINGVFADLNQLGIGPTDGFEIVDETSKWEDFLGLEAKRLSAAKTYIYLKVRMLFDPPSTSFHLAAMEKLAEEAAWRLNVVRENDLVEELDLVEEEV